MSSYKTPQSHENESRAAQDHGRRCQIETEEWGMASMPVIGSYPDKNLAWEEFFIWGGVDGIKGSEMKDSLQEDVLNSMRVFCSLDLSQDSTHTRLDTAFPITQCLFLLSSLKLQA